MLDRREKEAGGNDVGLVYMVKLKDADQRGSTSEQQERAEDDFNKAYSDKFDNSTGRAAQSAREVVLETERHTQGLKAMGVESGLHTLDSFQPLAKLKPDERATSLAEAVHNAIIDQPGALPCGFFF